ncbi:MAG: flagellar FliJ family protein [Phycisphaerales bacterium]|nr:flagellar FliJ family protein [Phycisphaerales bacterium]
MSRFVFPYETLLDVRRCEEHAQQAIVGSLETRRHELEGELRQRKGFLDSNREFTRTSLTGSVDIDGLRLHAGLAVQAMRRADSIVLQLAELQSRLVDARELLVDRMRSRRTVERLRERMLSRWTLEQNRCEHRLEDEAAMLRTTWQEVLA